MTWWSLRPDLAVCTPCSKFGAVVCVDVIKGGGAKWPGLPPPPVWDRCTPLSTPRRRTSAGVSLIAAPRGRLGGGRHDGAGDNYRPGASRPWRIGSTLQAGLGRRRRSSAQSRASASEHCERGTVSARAEPFGAHRGSVAACRSRTRRGGKRGNVHVIEAGHEREATVAHETLRARRGEARKVTASIARTRLWTHRRHWEGHTP